MISFLQNIATGLTGLLFTIGSVFGVVEAPDIGYEGNIAQPYNQVSVNNNAATTTEFVGDVIPAKDKTYSLGSVDKQWNAWFGSVTTTVNQTATGTTNLEQLIIDTDNTEALLVRKDSDGGDVFMVDTTNSSVGINTTPDSNVSLDVDGEWQYEVSDQNQNGMLFGVSSTDLPTIGPIIAGSEVSSSQIRYNNNTGRWEVEAPLRALSGLVLDDDEDFSVGTGSDYQMRYDSGNTQFEFENSNNNNIFTVQDGSQDVEFLGSVGIGTAPATSADLHIEKDNPRLRLSDTNGKTSDVFQSGSNLTIQTPTSNANFNIQNNSLNDVLNLDMDNEVVYNPQGKLIVDDTGVADETSNGAILTNDNTDNSGTQVNSYDGGIQISNSSQVDGSFSLFKFNHGASPDADGAYIRSSRVDNNQTTMELGQYDNGGNVAGTPYISMDENYNVSVPNGGLTVNGKSTFNDDHTEYGSMSTSSNATATTINTQDVYEEINVLDVGLTRGITFSNSDLTANTTGTYKVDYDTSLQAVNNNDVFELAVFVNGSEVGRGTCKTAVPNTGFDNCSNHSLIQLNGGDVVDLRVRNTSGADNVTVQEANFVITQQ